MDEEPIDDRLQRCLLGALGLRAFPLSASTKAYEVPGWDSLAHVKVIVAVEDEFDMKFEDSDILALQTVGDLQRLVRNARQASRPNID